MTPRLAKVLIGIKDPDECALVVFALRFAGYRVLKAASASELAALARQAQPNLLLVEYNFSGLDDSILRSSLENGGQTILYLVDPGANDRAARSSQMIDYLRKPVSPDRLTRKVNEVLRRQ